MAHLAADEFGVKWLVESGDPANSLINYLKRRGMRTFVLPRTALLYGADGLVVGYVPGDVLAAARLLDCVGVLSARVSQ